MPERCSLNLVPYSRSSTPLGEGADMTSMTFGRRGAEPGQEADGFTHGASRAQSSPEAPQRKRSSMIPGIAMGSAIVAGVAYAAVSAGGESAASRQKPVTAYQSKSQCEAASAGQGCAERQTSSGAVVHVPLFIPYSSSASSSSKAGGPPASSALAARGAAPTSLGGVTAPAMRGGFGSSVMSGGG